MEPSGFGADVLCGAFDRDGGFGTSGECGGRAVAGRRQWLTEFGWNTTPDPAHGNDFARHVTEKQQAEYTIQAFAIGRSYDWMGVMFIWNLNFQVTTSGPNDEKWGYGLLRRDWSPRPAFVALKTLND